MFLSLTGCTNPTALRLPWQLAPSATTQPAVDATAPPTPAPAPDRRGVIFLQVNLDILRARAPRGFFSQSEKIWNHIDEGAVTEDSAAMLRRNGFRVGRGKTAAWSPIKAILETEKQIQVSQSQLTVNNGLPLSLQIDPRYREQTLFLYRPDGSLGGVTSPQSTNYLHVEYAIPPTDPDSVMLEVMPEIRQRPGASELTINELGQLDQPIVEPTRVFRELACRMLIGPDEFCAIGPGRTVQQRYLMGSVLLCEEIQGAPWESMYFLTPRVIRTEQSLTR